MCQWNEMKYYLTYLGSLKFCERIKIAIQINFFFSEMDLHLDDLQSWFLHAVSVGEGKYCTLSWLKRSYQEYFGINTKLPEFEEKLKPFLHEKEVSF